MSHLSIQRLKDFRRANDAATFGSVRKRRKYGLRISRYNNLTDKEEHVYNLVIYNLSDTDPVRRFMFAKSVLTQTLKDIKRILSEDAKYDYAGLHRILFEEETLIGWCLTHPIIYRHKEAREIVEEYYRELMELRFDVTRRAVQGS